MKSQKLTVRTATNIYSIIIGQGASSRLVQEMNSLFKARQAIIISDSNVGPIYGKTIAAALEQEGWRVVSMIFPAGEQSKNLKQLGTLYDYAVEAGIDRNTPVVAVGGGVVGDLAGFFSATFLRGIPLVMVPTTLLAQVDSSVGGKTAVNHRGGKNLIGSIYPPCLVLIDPAVLTTLPLRELRAGLAEIIKYGIIGDGSFFAWLEEKMDLLLAGKLDPLAEAIHYAIKAKAEIVEKDEFEQDRRMILNFGHTAGHALESATNYSFFLHGEAVMAGMFIAAELSRMKNIVNPADYCRIKNLIARAGLKSAPGGLTADKVTDKLSQDKKRRDGNLLFILPEAVGSVQIVALHDRELIVRAVNSYLSFNSGC